MLEPPAKSLSSVRNSMHWHSLLILHRDAGQFQNALHLRLLVVVVPARAQGRAERVSPGPRGPGITTAGHGLVHAEVRVGAARVLLGELTHHLRGSSRTLFESGGGWRGSATEGLRRAENTSPLRRARKGITARPAHGVGGKEEAGEGTGTAAPLEWYPRVAGGWTRGRRRRVPRARVAVAAANERGTATGHVCQDNRTRRGWEGEIPRGRGRRFADGDVRRGARWRNRRGESVTYPRR